MRGGPPLGTISMDLAVAVIKKSSFIRDFILLFDCWSQHTKASNTIHTLQYHSKKWCKNAMSEQFLWHVEGYKNE